MSTTKNKNNMAGAWMNQKKEIEKLKSQIVVLESNQNGAKLDEEDEEIAFENERKRRQAIQDAEDKISLQIIKANKIRKNINPIRQIEIDSLMMEIQRENAEIEKHKAQIALYMAEIDATSRGDRDEELIKKQNDNVKITPNVLSVTVAPKPASQVNKKTDLIRARTTINRPKGGDIFLLFNSPAIIRCVMNTTPYFGLVEPNRKMIKCVKEDGTFNCATDKGVKSYLTKNIKLEDGRQKDVADITEPAKYRTEWTKKDDWIKCCKGEQNLYSSSKDGWKEIYYWTGNLNDPTKIDPVKWVCLYNVAYDGVKLN